MEKFITEDIWSEVNKIISEYNSKKFACISYVSTNNLNLIKGDVLICDASENSIKQGHTSINALKAYFELGVEIYSLEGLHSKHLTSDNYLVIGSANLSINSAQNLIESAIITDNQVLINESNIFANKLICKSEKITLDRITNLTEIRPLNSFTNENLSHSNRKKIFQSENETKIENISNHSLKVLLAEIRKNEQGDYVYLELIENDLLAEGIGKKNLSMIYKKLNYGKRLYLIKQNTPRFMGHMNGLMTYQGIML